MKQTMNRDNKDSRRTSDFKSKKSHDDLYERLTPWQIRRRSLWRRFSGFFFGGRFGGARVPVAGKDFGKKQRMGLVSFFIVLLVFGLKLWGGGGLSLMLIMFVAVISGAMAYIGLLWALRFDVSGRAYYTIVLQPALFVFASVLFIELFFFQEFQRIFESIIFGGLLLVITLSFYGSFLTANILNVATIKEIPLAKAAHTVSYIVALCTVYFSTYAFVVSGLGMLVLVPVLLLVYYFSALAHLSNLDLSASDLTEMAVISAFTTLMILISLFVWPLEKLLAPLLPTVAMYLCLGTAMHHSSKTLGLQVVLEYLFAILVVLGVIMMRAEWGVGGNFWM